MRGMALEHLGRHAEALEDYRQAVSLDETHASARGRALRASTAWPGLWGAGRFSRLTDNP
jgi:hypothetical protein